MTERQKMPSPAAVSRRLGEKFSRSESHTTRIKGFPIFSAGFTVRRGIGLPGRVKHVSVEYTVGDRGRYMTGERRLKVEQENLAEMQEYLEKYYRVARNDEDGPDDWCALLVFTKED